MSIPSRAAIINDAADAIKAIANSIKSDVQDSPQAVDDATLTAAFRAGANHMLEVLKEEYFQETVNVNVESDDESSDCSITVHFNPVRQLVCNKVGWGTPLHEGQIKYIEGLDMDLEEVKAELKDWLPKSEEPTATTDNTETPA